MAASTAIPRFLLPQLTWQAAGSARTLPARTLLSHHPWTALEQRRQLSSTPSRQIASARTSTPSQRRLDRQAELTRSVFNALSYSHQGSSSSPLSRTSSATSISSRATVTPSTFRHFSTTKPKLRDHHFDTLKFIQRLRDEGFSEEQATAMMRVLADVIEESIQNLTRTLVPREDAERATYTQKVDFTKLRSELLAADGTESQVARQTHERLANDIAKLNGRLRDEIGRTQASVRLDLNLEKGRIKEEANTQETKIKETESRIEQEVAGLKERIEVVKFNTLQWLLGFFTGTSALMLGAWRLLM